ncbi:hypothetical protein RND81_09G097100 [Saponaria officinalis]|uniref:Uncharacterized protein n=1 Tax=Saponaria officinalis TaxID=3572 RepID=A0AAW1IJS4_SAPOF
MVVYNLDETPDVFIAPYYYNDEFVYNRTVIKEEENRKQIHSINLRSDKLVIYGSEVKESMFKTLYESLIIRLKNGWIFVNCNGACYVCVGGKTYRPIHNIIFDWSSFGVIVPTSMNDMLKKQVEELEKAVENSKQQIELAKIEVESTKASLKASNDEIKELKKVQNELGLKVQKANEKVALTDFEVELYKIELESCRKELDEILDDLCYCKDEKAKMEVELNKMRDQFLSEISNSNKRNGDLEMKSKLLENELSSVRSELHSSKEQLECSNKNAKELEDQLCMVNKDLSSVQSELHIMQDRLLSEISTSNNRNHYLEMKSKTLENQLSLMQSELYSMQNQLKFSDKNVKELEEQLSSFKKNLKT